MKMQGLIFFYLILTLASPSLCVSFNVGTNDTVSVMEYGAVGDGKSDDTKAFLSAWTQICGTAIEGTPTLIIPKGKTFLLKTILLSGPCKPQSINVQIQGDIVAPTMDTWGSDKLNWIQISYINNLTINGGGQINGQGSLWWENCRHCQRPTALRFHSCNDLRVSYLSVIDTPGGHISINGCDGAEFSHMNIQAPGDSPNTDGFDIAVSKNIIIQNSTIAVGDDCIAINGGSSYINATGIACGPGHGISIGSLGKYGYETVEEVYVRNCSFNGTQNGARIKTFEDGSGYAKNITFEQLTFTNTRFPIFIDQHYFSTGNDTTSAVNVSDITYRGFVGTCSDENAINLNCSKFGCYNLVLDKINIASYDPTKKAQAYCNYAHGTVTSSIPNVSCLSN